MGKIDDIKAAISTVRLVEQLSNREPKGPDAQGRYIALCSFHEDEHESMRIFETGGFKCFTCGVKGGDVIDWFGRVHQLDKLEAIRTMHERFVAGPPARPKADPGELIDAPRLKSQETPRPIARPFVEIPRVGKQIRLHHPDKTPTLHKPSMVHVYRTADGAAHHAILRIESDGRKRFMPALWDGERWWALAQETPRKLYGLEHLATAKQILLVEGEKAADAARRRLPAMFGVLTWPGGAQAIGSIDWTPLYGHSIVLWPDNDPPGVQAMHAIAQRLKAYCDPIKMVDPRDLPPKGDAADVDEGVTMLEWLRPRVEAWVEQGEVEAQLTEEAVEVAIKLEAAKPPTDIPIFVGPDEVKARRTAGFPFHILGQSQDGLAYFLKKADGRIMALSLTAVARREVLCTLAPPHVWQAAFGGMTGPGPDAAPVSWNAICISAQAHIVDALEQLPTFDPNLTRGRGCWSHRGKKVALNRGDRVELDGEIADDNYLDGIVYERGAPLPVAERGLTNEEGHRLLSVLEECSWREPYAASALAGWIALAPICGALEWRPHVWVTGPSGSGKSTVVNEIVLAAIGTDLCVRLAGNTSEAGLRQVMRRDALPVVIDEAESDAKSIRSVLDLARSASTGDTIVRGSATGEPQIFHIRSAFCFASINPSVSKAADESRITQLELVRSRAANADKRYLAMRDALANLVDRDFGARLAARMIRLARITQANISVMEDAVTNRFGSRRLAQQWGALFGGLWSLTSEIPITPDEAANMAEMVPTSTVTTQLVEDDAFNMIATLCAYQVDVDGVKGRTRVPVSELIERLTTASDAEIVRDVGRIVAEEALGRVGLRVRSELIDGEEMKVVCVSRRHPALSMNVFGATPWANSYGSRLMDVNGARMGEGQLRFAGRRTTFTVVPARYFLGDDA